MIEVLAIVAFIALMVILAAVFLRILDRFRYPPQSPEEGAKALQDYYRRLSNPDWPLLAAKFGGSVPAAIASLYEDNELLRTRGLAVDEWREVDEFVPADREAFDPDQWFCPPDDAFVFATTMFGDPFFVRTSEVVAGLPVYLLHHDGGDTAAVAPTLEEFVQRIRASSDQPRV